MKNYKMTVSLGETNNSGTWSGSTNDIFETVVTAQNGTQAKQQVVAMYGGERKCRTTQPIEVR